MTDPSIAANLAHVRQEIVRLAHAHQRHPEQIQLLAVSKTKPAALILEAMAGGQVHFGENYLQEGLSKQRMIGEPGIEWHYIGAIQSNKTRPIAEHFHWVHTVDSLKIARRLSDQRPAHLPPLKVMVQVNVNDEATKAGLPTREVPALIDNMLALPRIEVRGLMAIPRQASELAVQCAHFSQVRTLFEAVRDRFGTRLAHFEDLSMGMSGDMEAAIAEGSTWVRIGTAIFGARTTT
jgi:PLP dependent protein